LCFYWNIFHIFSFLQEPMVDEQWFFMNYLLSSLYLFFWKLLILAELPIFKKISSNLA
jgi:hypothetical protein